MKPDSSTFKTLLIVSEIVIPAIALFGAYLIFKPLMKKNQKKAELEQGKDTAE